jgi:hypothetical protein
VPGIDTNAKVFIGLGIALVSTGVALTLLRFWGDLVAFDILLGVTYVLFGIGRKVTRRLSYVCLGAALVFLGFGLARLD